MQPLPDDVAELLTRDRAAALGASFVIGARHPDILLWAARMIGADWSQPKPAPKSNGSKRKLNGADRRLAARDKADEALVEAMKADPDATIGDWAESIGKSRTSTVTALHRLRDADRVESVEGRWKLTAPREPPPKWTKPVSAAHRAAEHHLT
jgi:hypothetical protein